MANATSGQPLECAAAAGVFFVVHRELPRAPAGHGRRFLFCDGRKARGTAAPRCIGTRLPARVTTGSCQFACRPEA